MSETLLVGILNAILGLKKRLEELVPECEVIVSTPVRRFDNKATSNIIDLVNKKIPGIGPNIITNSNIGSSDIGRRGLHLNDRGSKKLANNISRKLRSIR